MYVKARQMAFLGLLAAINTVCMILASVIKTNTLFLLAAAAFLVGISIREFGLRIGSGFFITCVLLGILLSPNKLYVLTFSGFSLYILGNEATYKVLARETFQRFRKVLFIIIRWLLFNAMFLPLLFLFPKLIYAGSIDIKIWIMLIVLGQFACIIYDKAYSYFQIHIWTKIRRRIHFFF